MVTGAHVLAVNAYRDDHIGGIAEHRGLQRWQHAHAPHIHLDHAGIALQTGQVSVGLDASGAQHSRTFACVSAGTSNTFIQAAYMPVPHQEVPSIQAGFGCHQGNS
jgi:hypothetical protein